MMDGLKRAILKYTYIVIVLMKKNFVHTDTTISVCVKFCRENSNDFVYVGINIL